MNTNNHPSTDNNSGNLFRLKGYSIRQKLPILIGCLLLLTVTILGGLSYIGVRNASLAIGRERLLALTGQLSTLFGQGATAVIAATKQAATRPVIADFLTGTGNRDSAMQALDKLRLDSTWPQVDLLDEKRQLVIQSALSSHRVPINIDSTISRLVNSPDSVLVGRLYESNDSVFYPVIATVTDNREIKGFLIRWRYQTATPDALEQFSRLLGTNARLYFGNNDGSLWTDLSTATEGPPVDIKKGEPYFEYKRKGGESLVAAAAPVPGTGWTMLIEFSQTLILRGAAQFLKWIVTIGALVILAGFFTAWWLSRRITKPLEKLTVAAAAITSGNYTTAVNIRSNDELGKLADAFNAMTAQLLVARDGLEQKVSQRTQQLEAVNNELEAFSYSVSHDLRAPLRSINGYANILNEDYASKLDDEAKRLTGKIISNGRKMGQLIDDLISFSQVARKEIRRHTVNMNDLVKSCEEELFNRGIDNKYLLTMDDLPPCKGDEGLLRQVWMNLLGNAIKYSSKKTSPRIEIGCISNGDMHTYFVRDNGAGFDMQYVHKLFGVFQRLHGNKDFEGTGIGLALTKRIIDRHHGAIYAEGKPGEGACFYFRLSAK